MVQGEWEGGISNQMLISKLFPFPQGWPVLENSNQKSMLQVFNYYFFSLTIKRPSNFLLIKTVTQEFLFLKYHLSRKQWRGL